MDILTASAGMAGILGLAVALAGVRIAMRSMRQSGIVAFRQQKQDTLNLFYEAQQAEQRRLDRLIEVLIEIPPDESYLHERILNFKKDREDAIAEVQQLQAELNEIPSTPDPEPSAALEKLSISGNSFKISSPKWDDKVNKYVWLVRELLQMKAATEEKTMEGEEARIEREKLLKRLEVLSDSKGGETQGT
jgi:hypothetical protein